MLAPLIEKLKIYRRATAASQLKNAFLAEINTDTYIDKKRMYTEYDIIFINFNKVHIEEKVTSLNRKVKKY